MPKAAETEELFRPSYVVLETHHNVAVKLPKLTGDYTSKAEEHVLETKQGKITVPEHFVNGLRLPGPADRPEAILMMMRHFYGFHPNEMGRVKNCRVEIVEREYMGKLSYMLNFHKESGQSTQEIKFFLTEDNDHPGFHVPGSAHKICFVPIKTRA